MAVCYLQELTLNYVKLDQPKIERSLTTWHAMSEMELLNLALLLPLKLFRALLQWTHDEIHALRTMVFDLRLSNLVSRALFYSSPGVGEVPGKEVAARLSARALSPTIGCLEKANSHKNESYAGIVEVKGSSSCYAGRRFCF